MTVNLSIAADGNGWIGAWEPGLGDASLLGYTTTIVYAIATVLAFRAYRTLRASLPSADLKRGLMALARTNFEARLTALWFMFGLGLLALTLNKQLDLQTALTEAARAVAHSQGWYERRRLVQVVFIGILGIGAAGVSLLLAWLVRPVLQRVRITLAGIILLVLFVAIRGASFHHLDELLGNELGGTRIHRIMEIAALLLVSLGAHREGCPLQPPSSSSESTR